MKVFFGLFRRGHNGRGSGACNQTTLRVYKVNDSHAFSFSNVQPGTAPPASSGLVVAIRTDAAHATARLRSGILSDLGSNKLMESFSQTSDSLTSSHSVEQRLKSILHQHYQRWGHEVLAAMAECLDYSRYGIHNADEKRVDVHFYDAQSLARHTITRGLGYVKENYGQHTPVLFVSLDDMIQGEASQHFKEIGFSRLFSLDGLQQLGYVARPGKQELHLQIDAVKKELLAIKKQTRKKPVVMLVEDNVRNAKTIDWIVDQMNGRGVFDQAKLGGVATCFNMANPVERENLKKTPVVESVDYGNTRVDVWTPRDLFFDGLVVKGPGEPGRLPGIFMPDEAIEERFKICPDKIEAFVDRVIDANRRFCYSFRELLKRDIPIAWFSGAEPITRVTGLAYDPYRPMTNVLTNWAQHTPKTTHVAL